ncbi:Adenine deaminase [butyrate-producing bacterium SS3/4]|nr:Adenine deaminase [butyrate-producing bacterium SS3/4]
MRPDFILKNVMVYQTFRQCFEKRDVAVAGETFYCISPAISYPGVEERDGKGRYMLPGLVDIHMHIESSMTYPGEFSRITLPYGVTTVVADAHEMANVFGMDGIRAFMAQKTKQDIFWAIPSSVPATNEKLETAGAALGVKEISEMASLDGVLCLGEIMNYKDLSAEGESRTRALIDVCRKAGKNLRIEGHCPGLTGTDLNRFIYEGVDADHTQQTPQSVMEKTELGMFLELQFKSLTPEVVKTVCDHELYENVALVTDDTMADKLLTGHLNKIIETAVKAGMPMEKAIYCATWTPSRRMHLDDRGMIAPGKIADFMLLDSLDGIEPVVVYKKGECVYCRADEACGAAKGRKAQEACAVAAGCGAEAAKMQAAGISEVRADKSGQAAAPVAAACSFPDSFYRTINCRPAEISDFVLKAEDPDAKWAEVNVMKIGTFGTATTPVKRRVEVKDGVLDWKSAGLSLAVVFERYGKNGNVGYGLVEGALTKPGAVATTWSHDSHNLFVLGTDENDMKLAQRRVLELQGAYVVFAGGKSLAEARLTIGGIVSDQPIEVLGQELKEVRAAMEGLGYVNNNVIMSMSTLCLPVSPKLKLTDHGLLTVPGQEHVPLVEKYGK